MIRVVKGKYKSISMRVDENLDVIVKAPRRVGDAQISEFIIKHKNWLLKQQEKILIANEILKTYDFDHYVYVFNNPIKCDKKEQTKFYLSIFNNLVGDLLKKLSLETEIKYNSLKPTNSIRIWGSMDRNQNMKLNIKLLLLPKEIVEYVIIHELCHEIEFNHSKNFWAKVKKYCPNYKVLRKELEIYRAVLKLKIFKIKNSHSI